MGTFNAEQTTVFKSALVEMYSLNEAPAGTAYQFSLSTAKSTYSFGQAQWDVGKNGDAQTFLKGLVDEEGNRAFSDADIQKLAKQTEMEPGDLNRLNTALSEHSSEVDTFFDQKLTNDVQLVENIVSELNASGNTEMANFIATNQNAQLLLVDYNNQYGISGVDGTGNAANDGAMMQYLKGKEVKLWDVAVQFDGKADIDDLSRFIFSTEYARKTAAGAQDILRRFKNVYSVNIAHTKQPDKVDSLFTSAQRFILRRDPLTLDLDGDGLETTGVNPTTPIMFDHDGDGIKTATGWVKSDDGFLVLDRNGNGVIDSGRELFGDSTPLSAGGTAADGFSALADQDTNSDGKVDSNDTQFANLRVWRDLNQNGISEAGELTTLSANNIAAINTSATQNSQTLSNGNQIADLGTYIKTDGSTGTVGETSQLADVNLAEDTFHREFTDQIPVATEVQALPTLQGSGALRDLREAASLGNAEASTLTSLLTQYANATTRDAQLAQLEQLLDAWADTSGMSETLDDRDTQYVIRYDAFGAIQRSQNYLPNFDGSPGNDGAVGAAYWNRDLDLNLTPEYKNLISGWSQKIHILEAFNGRYFFNLPDHTQPGVSAVSGMTLVMSSGDGGGGGIGGESPFLHIRYSQAQLDLLNQSYDALKQSVYDALFLQTRGKPYLDAITLNVDEAGNIVLDYSAMETLLRDHMTQDARTGFQDLADLVNSTGRDLASAGWQIPTFMSDITSVLETTDVGRGFLDNPKSWGLCEDFLLLGDTVANSITGTTQADALLGGAGNNQLNGASASEAWPLAA